MSNKGIISNNGYWVYILRCNDNSLYTGIAKDILKRYLQHINKTSKCKFTRRKDKHPLRLVQCWRIKGGRGNATKVELFIKKSSKKMKEELVKQPEELKKLFLLKSNCYIDIFPCDIKEIYKKLNKINRGEDNEQEIRRKTIIK